MANKSSFIEKFTHNPKREDLKVTMKTGAEYVYHPVSKKLFDFLGSYESPGEAYNSVIKRNKALTSMKVLK